MGNCPATTASFADNRAHIICPEGKKVGIKKATYGPTATLQDYHTGTDTTTEGNKDFTSDATKLNTAQNPNEFKVDYLWTTSVGDPAPGVGKNVMITYDCQ